MFYATCCDPAGAWSEPSRYGRCGEPVSSHRSISPGLVTGARLGLALGPGAVCDGLVCSECGECQGGLRR